MNSIDLLNRNNLSVTEDKKTGLKFEISDLSQDKITRGYRVVKSGLTYSQAERVIERLKRERYGEEYEYDCQRRLSDL